MCVSVCVCHHQCRCRSIKDVRYTVVLAALQLEKDTGRFCRIQQIQQIRHNFSEVCVGECVSSLRTYGNSLSVSMCLHSCMYSLISVIIHAYVSLICMCAREPPPPMTIHLWR